MLDTTGWKIKISPEQVKSIIDRSKEFSEYDHETKTTNFRIVKDNIHTGSYDSNITLKCNGVDEVYIEFSVPKQYLGNNVELLYPSSLEQALEGVYHSLVDRFGDFPSYKNWHVQRLDLCYGWRFSSQEQADSALGVLKTLDFSRKNKYLYPESVMWRGRTRSIKFYLKNNEFRKHDLKRLLSFNPSPIQVEDEQYKTELNDNNFLKRIYELSLGVLRFEITYRKDAIVLLFGKKIITYKDLLDKDFLETTLSLALNKLTMNLDKTVTDDNEALRRLKTIYSSQKAIRLLNFYILYNSPKINHRQLIKANYNYSTIWRYKKDIANANVGLPNHTKPIPFNLDIPSELVVNPDPASSSAS